MPSFRFRFSLTLLPTALTVLAVLSACGSSHTVDAGDTGADTAVDSGADTSVDSAIDSATDAGPECEGLPENECVGSSTCAPLYDDFCCPTCVPIGACADCSRPQMYRCAPVAEACDPTSCGTANPAHCGGEAPDCGSANVVSGYRCDIPGCVAAIEAGCADDCPLECVPVTEEICVSSCRSPAPECPESMAPERDGFCYTGRCISASACEPASVPAP